MPDQGESRTRKGLDAALRELLKRKPLNQLRVRELTELCGLRRQSFYYHFRDVYDLFDWSLQREGELLRQRREECLTWEQALLDLLDRLAEHRSYYRALLEHQGRAGLRKVFQLSGMLGQALAYYRSRCGLPLNPVEEELQLRCGEMVLLSLLEDWLKGDLELEPKTIMALLEKAVRQSVAGAALQTLQGQRRWEP